MNRIITTTTSSIEGWDIKEYFQPVSSNVVVGANMFSDISAALTDFFGGRSGSYERKLQEIYDQAILNLNNKAKAIGANAVVGLKIDIGEVSGKGNQMFMVSAVGTPVRASKKGDILANLSHDESYTVYDGELVDKKVRAKKLLISFEGHKPKLSQIPDKTIKFIVESRLPELSGFVLDLLTDRSIDVESTPKSEKLPAYFSNLDKDHAIDAIYNYVVANEMTDDIRNKFLNIVFEYDLIDYKRLAEVLNSGHVSAKKFALAILTKGKFQYTAEDINLLQEYADRIPGLFEPLGATDTVKGRFSSKTRDVWICVCGTKNDQGDEHCSRCSRDIYGFAHNEAKPSKVVEVIKNRLDMIGDIGKSN